jgi:hypothetical protein
MYVILHGGWTFNFVNICKCIKPVSQLRFELDSIQLKDAAAGQSLICVERSLTQIAVLINDAKLWRKIYLFFGLSCIALQYTSTAHWQLIGFYYTNRHYLTCRKHLHVFLSAQIVLVYRAQWCSKRNFDNFPRIGSISNRYRDAGLKVTL